jgi:hypothetical protein
MMMCPVKKHGVFEKDRLHEIADFRLAIFDEPSVRCTFLNEIILGAVPVRLAGFSSG